MIRYSAYLASIVLALLALLLATTDPHWWWGVAGFGALAALGTADLLQRKSTLRRNYPLLAHFRYGLETIGPEMRQYFIQSDTAEVPFSREQRALVYQRAKHVNDVRPFGTLQDVYGLDYEWINHSLAPTAIPDHDFRIVIGAGRARPYSASVFNISAMSFGALSAAAIHALNAGAKRGGFYSEERFAAQAVDPQVKMIEVKLSQGAKPGHGGMLPAAKLSAEIAATRGVPMGQDCVSPAAHSAFSTPLGLLQFVARLRKLSDGKPVGFKLAIGHPWEWFGIAKAMQEQAEANPELLPDFIVVDGAEGGTGAAPAEFVDHVGVPMHEGLMLVHNTLVGLGLRDRIKIGAAGKIVSAFDIARALAMGADWCNAARGYMFALGCIQSLSCHTNRCPTGIATQDPARWKQLDVADKSVRVATFHANTLRALRDLLCAAGLQHPDQLGLEHILRRVSPVEVRSLSALYRYLQPGELLGGRLPEHAVFREFWQQARSDAFMPPAHVARLRDSKAS